MQLSTVIFLDQDRKRRIRYVASRAATLAAIPVANVRRIAEQLDKIKSDQEYVIIGNVIEDTLDLLDVVTEGEIEPTTFSEEAGPPLRTKLAMRETSSVMCSKR